MTDWRKQVEDFTAGMDSKHDSNLKGATKRWFWYQTPAGQVQRKITAEKATKISLSFDSEKQAEEIFWKCWGEDRGEKLYKQLAEEYNVSPEGIINLVRSGNHVYCPVSADTLEKMKREWTEKYGSYKIVVTTPGRDMLDIYDRLYVESDQYKKVANAWKMTTPSVVYHCRYNLKNPTPQTVREYCDSIGIPRIKNDLGQYKQLLKRWAWLKPVKSQTFEFDSYIEAAEFLTSHPVNTTGKKISREAVFDKIGMSWRDNSDFPGFLIKKLYEQWRK